MILVSITNHLTMNLDDKLGVKKDMLYGVHTTRQGKLFRTSIDAVDQFGNTLFTQLENNVVLGGSLYVLEKLFNVRSPLQVATLNEINQINADSSKVSPTDPFPSDHYVCLWGVGIGGSGDAIGNVRPVNFYEREIGSKGNSTEMVPFRVVDAPLTGRDAEKYFFRKSLTGGKIGYYLKTFESKPVIKTLWGDGVDGEDGTEVTADVYNTDRQDDIEVFAEIVLHLTKREIREYFTMIGQVEKARMSTIALCAGIKHEVSSGVYDYANISMITKLNFGNEMLENKEITFRYRIFTN